MFMGDARARKSFKIANNLVDDVILFFVAIAISAITPKHDPQNVKVSERDVYAYVFEMRTNWEMQIVFALRSAHYSLLPVQQPATMAYVGFLNCQACALLTIISLFHIDIVNKFTSLKKQHY